MDKRDLRSMKKGSSNTYGSNVDDSKTQKQPDKDDIRNVQDTISKYQGKSEDEMFSELMKMVDKEKKDGSFNIDTLASFARNAAPMLSSEQREKMEAIIKQLK